MSYQYVFHAIGLFVFPYQAMMIMDDFGNAVVANCEKWTITNIDIVDR